MASMWNAHYEVSKEIMKAKKELVQFFKEEFKKANLPEKYVKDFISLEKGNPMPFLVTKEEKSE